MQLVAPVAEAVDTSQAKPSFSGLYTLHTPRTVNLDRVRVPNPGKRDVRGSIPGGLVFWGGARAAPAQVDDQKGEKETELVVDLLFAGVVFVFFIPEVLVFLDPRESDCGSSQCPIGCW